MYGRPNWSRSHPLTGGCGLKRGRSGLLPGVAVSPPHGGVWIETQRGRTGAPRAGGHPLTGGCGLKQELPVGGGEVSGHPLTGGCGLKRRYDGDRWPWLASPPHGGVWIETRNPSRAIPKSRRHPLTGGCGLKPADPAHDARRAGSPPHGGVWIETRGAGLPGDGSGVTPSRGGVD